jgi:hypothetical protein
MDWTSYIGPTILPSLLAGAIAILVVFINRWTNLKIHKEKFEFDKQISELKFAFDKRISIEKLNHERQQAIFKRRFDLAEQVLADAYQFRDMMAYVRNGAVFQGEGDTREKEKFETDNEARNRRTYFVPLERLQARSEFISAMMVRRVTCRAHFGEDAEKAFDAFHKAIHRVRISASMLSDMSSDYEQGDKDFKEELRRDIWQPLAEYKGDDRVGKDIDAGVELIESFCGPVLQWVDRAN